MPRKYKILTDEEISEVEKLIDIRKTARKDRDNLGRTILRREREIKDLLDKLKILKLRQDSKLIERRRLCNRALARKMGCSSHAIRCIAIRMLNDYINGWKVNNDGY